MKKKRKTITITTTLPELEEVINELEFELFEKIKKMTPSQRKKDKEEAKKWVVKTKKNKKSISVIAQKIK